MDSSQQVLCVDLLDFTGSFLQGKSYTEQLECVETNVQEFVEASKNSGYKLMVFIHKGINSPKPEKKWRKRRMKEMGKGRKSVMPGLSRILGALFQEHGVEVHYIVQFSTIDCDDTIAAFAYHHKGIVLSQGKGFLRYYAKNKGDKPFRIYRDFAVKPEKNHEVIPCLEMKRQREGKKHLRIYHDFAVSKPEKIHEEIPFLQLKMPGEERKASRKIPAELPATKPNMFFVPENKEYLRGCGSPLTHETNPHLMVKYFTSIISNINFNI